MRQLWFSLLLITGLGFLLVSVPTSAAEKKSDEATIKKLIDQLGSDDFAEREQAQKELRQIGMPAYEPLKKAVQDTRCDPEVQQRALAILDRLEREVVSAKILTPTKVQLKYQDTPLKEAVADFAKKSGYSIEVFDPKAGLKDKKVTLDTGEVSFFEALDQFCDAAGLVETTLAEVAQEVQKGGGPPPGPPGAPGGAVPPVGPGGVGVPQPQPGVIRVQPIRVLPVKPMQAKPVEAKPVEDKPVENKKPVEKKEIEKKENEKQEQQGCAPVGDNDPKADDADAKKKVEAEKKQAEAKEAAKKLVKQQAQAVQVQAVQVQIAPIAVPIQIGPGGAIMGPPGMPGVPGVVLPFPVTTQIVLKEGKVKKEATAYSGSFRIKAMKDAAALLGAVGPKEHLVGLQITPEPKLQIAALLDVKITRALDDQDQVLRPLVDPTQDDGNNPWGGAVQVRKRIAIAPIQLGGIGFNGSTQHLPVKLVKGAKEATTLKELTGTVSAQVLTRPEVLLEATDIRKASGKTFNGKEGGSMKILAVTENNGILTVRVEYDAPKDVLPVNGMNNQFNQFGGGMGGMMIAPGGLPGVPAVPVDAKAPAKKPSITDLALYGLTLVDDKGDPMQHRSIGVGGRWGQNGLVTNEYTFTWQVPKGQEPSKLVFSGQRNATIDIPFTLKNVALK